MALRRLIGTCLVVLFVLASGPTVLAGTFVKSSDMWYDLGTYPWYNMRWFSCSVHDFPLWDNGLTGYAYRDGLLIWENSKYLQNTDYISINGNAWDSGLGGIYWAYKCWHISQKASEYEWPIVELHYGWSSHSCYGPE